MSALPCHSEQTNVAAAVVVVDAVVVLVDAVVDCDVDENNDVAADVVSVETSKRRTESSQTMLQPRPLPRNRG